MEFVLIDWIGNKSFDYFFSLFFWFGVANIPFQLAFTLFSRRWSQATPFICLPTNEAKRARCVAFGHPKATAHNRVAGGADFMSLRLKLGSLPLRKFKEE